MARLLARTMKWARLVLACASLGWIGCVDPCGSNEVSVRKSGGGSVCVPTSQRASSEPPKADGEVGPDERYGSVKLPPSAPDASSSNPPSSAPAGCRSEDAGGLTVHLVAKGGAAAPVLVPSAPPDARYVLVQATWFGGDAGAPPIDALRAELVVQGSVYVLGTRAVVGALVDDAESATLTIAAGAATHVCGVGSGDVVPLLLPDIGATTAATASWDAVTATLTIVLTTPAGADVELVFVRD